MDSPLRSNDSVFSISNPVTSISSPTPLEQLREIVERQKWNSFSELNSSSGTTSRIIPPREVPVSQDVNENLHSVLTSSAGCMESPTYLGFSLPTNLARKCSHSTTSPHIDGPSQHGSTETNSNQRCLAGADPVATKRLTVSCDAVVADGLSNTACKPPSWRMGEDLIRRHFGSKGRASLDHLRDIVERQKRRSYGEPHSAPDTVPQRSLHNEFEPIVPHEIVTDFHPILRKVTEGMDPPSYLGFSLPTRSTGKPSRPTKFLSHSAGPLQRRPSGQRPFAECPDSSGAKSLKRLTAVCNGLDASDKKDLAKTVYSPSSWRMGQELIRRHFGLKQRGGVYSKPSSESKDNRTNSTPPLSEVHHSNETTQMHPASATTNHFLKKATTLTGAAPAAHTEQIKKATAPKSIRLPEKHGLLKIKPATTSSDDPHSICSRRRGVSRADLQALVRRQREARRAERRRQEQEKLERIERIRRNLKATAEAASQAAKMPTNAEIAKINRLPLRPARSASEHGSFESFNRARLIQFAYSAERERLLDELLQSEEDDVTLCPERKEKTVWTKRASVAPAIRQSGRGRAYTPRPRLEPALDHSVTATDGRKQQGPSAIGKFDNFSCLNDRVPISKLRIVQPADVPAVSLTESSAPHMSARFSAPSSPHESRWLSNDASDSDEDDRTDRSFCPLRDANKLIVLDIDEPSEPDMASPPHDEDEPRWLPLEAVSASDPETVDTSEGSDHVIDDVLPEKFEHHRANFHSFSKRHVFSPHKNPPTAVEKNFTEADDIKRLIYSDSLRFSAVHKRCRRDFPGHTALNVSDNSAPKDRWAVPSINRPTIETKTLTNSGVNTDPLGSLANFLSASDRSRHSSAQSSTSPHTPIAAANDALSSDASTGHGGVGQRNFVLNAAEQAVSSTPCREHNERRDFGSQTHHSTNTLVKNSPRSIATTLGLQSLSETNQLEFLTGSLTQLSDMESLRRFAVDRSEAAGLAYLFQDICRSRRIADVGVTTKPPSQSIGVNAECFDARSPSHPFRFESVLEVGDRFVKTQQGSRCRHVADVGVAIKPQLQSVGVSVDLGNARSSPPAPPLLEGISADVDECTRIELPFREKSPKGKSASPPPILSEHWLYSGEMGPDHAKGDTRSRSDTVSTSIPRVYEKNATATSDTPRAPAPDRRYSGSDAEFVSDEHEHTVTRSLLTNRSRSGRSYPTEHVSIVTTSSGAPIRNASVSGNHNSDGTPRSVSEAVAFPDVDAFSHSDGTSAAFEIDTASELATFRSTSVASEVASVRSESVATDNASDDHDATLVGSAYSGDSEIQDGLTEGQSKTHSKVDDADYSPRLGSPSRKAAETSETKSAKKSPSNGAPSGNRCLTPNTQAMVEVKKILAERAISLKSRRERAKKLLALSRSLEVEENEVVQLERKALQAAQAKRAQLRSNRCSPSSQGTLEVMRKDILLSQSERYISDFSEFMSSSHLGSKSRQSATPPFSPNDLARGGDKSISPTVPCETSSPRQLRSKSGPPSSQKPSVAASVSPTPVNTPSRVDSTCTDAGISVHSVTEADDLTAATSAASASAAATEPEDELTISEVQSKASDEHRRPTEESNHESFCPTSGDDTNRLFTSESALNVTLTKTPKYSEETHDDRSTEDDLEETSGKEFGSSDSLESESVRLPELKQASEHSDSPTVVASSDVLRTAVRYAAIVEDGTSEPNESDLYRAAEPCCVPSMEQLSENLAAKTLVRSPTVRIGSVSNVEDVRPASAIGQSNELTKATDYKTPLLTKADQQKTLFRQNLVDDVTNTLFSEILSGVIDSAISHSRDTLAVHEHKHFADHPITITTDDSGKASSDVVSSPRLHPASAVAFPLDEEFLVDNDDTTSDTVSIGSLFTAEHLRGLVPDIPSRTAYLVHEAVEYLWRARSDATEKLQERAIESAICHPPESFSFTQTDEADLDSTLHSTPDLRFVSRRLIFDLIAEFVQQVYSQESTGSHGSPSIGKPTKPRVTSAQFRLWKGPNRPETFDALLCLVKNHLHQQLGLQSCFSNPQNPGGRTESSFEPAANFHLDNLSRLTQWSLSKKSAFDRLLELELRAEECSWLAYGPIEKRLKNALAEEIWDEMLQEAVSSMVEISRKSAPPPYHLSD